jgi:hypothetical protein
VSRYEFQLHFSPEACLDYYRGTIRQVIVRCASGQTFQFSWQMGVGRRIVRANHRPAVRIHSSSPGISRRQQKRSETPGARS